MFSDRPTGHNTTQQAPRTQKKKMSMNEMSNIHNHTQDYWENRCTIWDDRLEKVEREVHQLKKLEGEKHEKLDSIIETQAVILTRLNYKKNGDAKRNGIMEKLDHEDRIIEERLTSLEAKVPSYTQILNGMNNLTDRIKTLEDLKNFTETFEIKKEKKSETRWDRSLKIIPIILTILSAIYIIGVKWLGW